jgi:tRNA pseudouridine38-40 synthase
MRKIALVLEYDGTNYFGWQKQNQPNQNSVQVELEKALKKVYGVPIEISASGRTDRGVHAAGQVVDYKFYNKIFVPIHKFHTIINNYLPKDIKVLSAQFVKLGFSSRFYAIAREYSYTINNRDTVFRSNFESYVPYKLDIDLLNQAAAKFLGEHDFTSFSKNNRDTKSYVCDVQKCHWIKIDDNRFRFEIKSNRFVYSMVRSLVGFMIDVGRGKRSIDEIDKLLITKHREFTSPLAPPEGLILEKVFYPKDTFNNDSIDYEIETNEV